MRKNTVWTPGSRYTELELLSLCAYLVVRLCTGSRSIKRRLDLCSYDVIAKCGETSSGQFRDRFSADCIARSVTGELGCHLCHCKPLTGTVTTRIRNIHNCANEHMACGCIS